MKNKSFTLIELLVVIVIIGVLAGVIMVTTTSSVSNATLARAKAFSSNVQNSMLLNLVSEWTFDDPAQPLQDSWGVNSGTTATATYKNSNTGNCAFGGCYEFDTAGDYFRMADATELRMTTGGTVSAWIYPESRGILNDFGRIIDKSTDTNGANGFILYMTASSSLTFTANGSTGTASINNA